MNWRKWIAKKIWGCPCFIELRIYLVSMILLLLPCFFLMFYFHENKIFLEVCLFYVLVLFIFVMGPAPFISMLLRNKIMTWPEFKTLMIEHAKKLISENPKLKLVLQPILDSVDKDDSDQLRNWLGDYYELDFLKEKFKEQSESADLRQQISDLSEKLGLKK